MMDPECAKCGSSVYVPDGYDWNEGDMCVSCMTERIAALTAERDALKGNVALPEDKYQHIVREWHAMATEYAQKVRGEIREMKQTEMVQACEQQGDVTERMLYEYMGIEDCREAMTAAARVLLDEALGPVTDEEWRDEAQFYKHEQLFLCNRGRVEILLMARRARILPESTTARIDKDKPHERLEQMSEQQCEHPNCKETPTKHQTDMGWLCQGHFDCALEITRAERRLMRVEHEFSNFHRNLCERFGYSHDPVNWKRDQISLIEHITTRILPESKPDAADAAVEAVRKHLKWVGSVYAEDADPVAIVAAVDKARGR